VAVAQDDELRHEAFVQIEKASYSAAFRVSCSFESTRQTRAGSPNV
jgi:hypothetical protein